MSFNTDVTLNITPPSADGTVGVTISPLSPAARAVSMCDPGVSTSEGTTYLGRDVVVNTNMTVTAPRDTSASRAAVRAAEPGAEQREAAFARSQTARLEGEPSLALINKANQYALYFLAILAVALVASVGIGASLAATKTVSALAGTAIAVSPLVAAGAFYGITLCARKVGII